MVVGPITPFLSQTKTHDKSTQPPNIHQRKILKVQEKLDTSNQRIALESTTYLPHANPAATSDPFTTLFISRLSYDLDEPQILKEFEKYGSVDKLVLVKDKEGKMKGYGFVQYTNESDLKAAYKMADGIKLGGRRICVDVERGRTVEGWKPKY